MRERGTKNSTRGGLALLREGSRRGPLCCGCGWPDHRELLDSRTRAKPEYLVMALHKLAQVGDNVHFETCLDLLGRGLSLRELNGLFFSAALGGNAEIISTLLEGGVDPDPSWFKNFDTSPLGAAAKTGSLDAVRLLIVKGAKVNPTLNDQNIRTGVQRSPLMEACIHGQTETAKLLLAEGANPDAVSQWGTTPLGYAIRNHQNEVAQVLISCVANVNQRMSQYTAWDEGDGEVGAVEMRGETALMQAACCGNLAGARILIEAGAGSRLRDWNGDDARILAADRGYDDLVLMLGEAVE